MCDPGNQMNDLTKREMDQLCINTIRTLSIDAIQAANSGHPGTPMAMAPVAYELWQRFLRFDPEDPIWPNRDRFVLSAGHASMLLYSLLHLARVKAVDPDYETLGELSVKLDDIKHFRQLGSKAAGHPEYRWTSGVETTTGPLGQGVATSIGMAIASKWLAARFNRPDFELFDFDVYTLAGDGDLMEGVSYEAASVAGHLRLDNLCWIYDNNRVTIDGSTALAFSDDVATRFIGQNWNVTRIGDANDLEMLVRAFETFKREDDRPTLIIVDSHIGYGAPDVQDTAKAHGEPLGEEEVRAAKRSYGWPEDAQFLIPDGVVEHFADGVGARGRTLRSEWEQRFDRYRGEHPELAEQIERMQRRALPDGWDGDIPEFPAGEDIATRKASGEALNAVARTVTGLGGGAADLTGSTSVGFTFDDAGVFSSDARGGRYFHFGIREHGMAGIVNGLSLSKLRPYGATYLIFSDYAREPIRLSALMEIPAIWIFSHDSIGLGEDGPTHQPVEQLASLRAMPGLVTIRPCDANEAAEAWRVLMRFHHSPVALVLTRQNVPVLDRGRYASATGLERGGYVLADPGDGEPELILIGTGSEVHLCVDAYEQLTGEGEKVRVVSMPSWELFDRQPLEYKEDVLPSVVTARVSVEQASTLGWERFVGPEGTMIGMHTFGASAPLKDVQSKFGFTPDRVVAACREQLQQHGRVKAR
jgi:transketolase